MKYLFTISFLVATSNVPSLALSEELKQPLNKNNGQPIINKDDPAIPLDNPSPVEARVISKAHDCPSKLCQKYSVNGSLVQESPLMPLDEGNIKSSSSGARTNP